MILDFGFAIFDFVRLHKLVITRERNLKSEIKNQKCSNTLNQSPN